MIYRERHGWIFGNVAQALEVGIPFRFLVDGDVDPPVDAGEANRNQVRTAKLVGGGQAGDAVGVEESRQFRL